MYEALARHALIDDVKAARQASRKAAGDLVDLRARALMAQDRKLTYMEEMRQVLASDAGLREQYAGRPRGFGGDL